MTMKTIQISPKKEDCRIEGGKITGWMPLYNGGGVLYTYQAPENMQFEQSDMDAAMKAFRAAIALSDRRWQVEDALNAQFGDIKGEFKIQDCPVNPYANERN